MIGSWGATASQKATAAAVGKVIAQSSMDTIQGLSGGPVAAALAGVISVIKGIIQAVTEAKVRQADAVAWATRLGIPNAKDYPRFVVDVSLMRPAERLALRDQVAGDYDGAKTDKARRDATFKIATIDQLMTMDALRLRGELPPPAAPEVLRTTYAVTPEWPYWLGGGMLATAALVWATRGRA